MEGQSWGGLRLAGEDGGAEGVRREGAALDELKKLIPSLVPLYLRAVCDGCEDITTQ